MKKWIAAFLCLICVLSSLVGCGGDVPPVTDPDTQDPTDTDPADIDPADTDPAVTDPDDTVEDTPMTEAAYIMKFKDGAKGVVTIVHDDGSLNTVAFLDREFEEHNLRGTVAMIANRVISVEGVKNNNQIKLWQNYLDTGRFDIACHSYTHKFWGITDKAETGVYLKQGTTTEVQYSTKDGNITFETQGARDALRDCFPGQRVLAFVKPGFGQYIDENGKKQSISPEGKRLIQENFIGSRSGGTSTQVWAATDYYSLTSFQVSLKHDLSQWTGQVDAAAKYGRWIIFMFHDIIPDSSVTSSTSTLKVKQSTASGLMEHIGGKVADGELWCAFLEDGMMYSQEIRSAKGTVATYSDKIEVSLTHELDVATFNYPLTVRVNVPAEWTSVLLTHADGTTETLTPFVNGDQMCVYANVVPDGSVAVLRNAE